MRTFLRKNLLFFTYSHCSSSQPRTLLFRFQLCEFSSSPTPYSHWKRLDEESRNVRVSVWWDFENCNVPAGVNVTKVAPAITDAVRANGIKGPLHITAFGDVLQLSRANQEALAFTGIHLTHIPNGGKNSADRSLLVDLLYWVSQNPPPAHLFLISGDRDFAGILHRLRMNNYNILLAIPGKAPDVLRSAATIMWQWPSLLKGEDLTGKHFNHPPDGPFGSWYGNSKVPLENPFSSADQSTSSSNVEIHEPSPGGIPKSFMRRVRHILSSHPNGIAISDLRTELTKCDVSLGKSMFGYKSFSRLLLSIPHVQLKHLGHGSFCVHLVTSEPPEAFERSTAPSSASAVENDESGYTITPKLHNEGKNIDRDAHRTPLISSLHEKTDHDDSKSLISIPSQGKPIKEFVSHKSSVGGEKVVDVANAQLSESQLSPNENDVSKNEMGSFEMGSKMLSDDDIVRSEDVSPKALEKKNPSGKPSAGTDYTILENNDITNCESGKSTAKSILEIQSRKEVDEVCHSPDSSAADDSLVEKRPDGCAETHSKRPTFFSWIRSWWPFSKSNAKAAETHQNNVTSNFEDSKSSELDQTASQLEELKPSEPRHNVSHSGKPELFSSGSFWNDMESFVFTPKGSFLISQSKSREDLAHKLQQHGPMDLKSLTENYIFQLVELLIAEKKWLNESPSQAFPFRLTQSVQKRSLSGKSNGATGLRSLFLSRISQPNLHNSFEHDVEKQCQSIQQTRVSRPATETKYTEMSRNDILVDCQKLVTEILKQHPEGYNIGSFRKQFFNRYGYHLDIKKLGYQKLAYLMQIMPGVKLESTYIYPSVPGVCNSETSILKAQATNDSHEDFNSDNELSDTSPKENNMESPWEELGPVSVKNTSQNDKESYFTQKAIELDTPNHPNYEPVISDYDSSESEGDSSCVTQPEEHEQGKPKYDEHDSSFWQALDSWHSSKEGETNVKKSDNVDVNGNSLLDILSLSPDSTRGTISKNSLRTFREKQRPQKYSFVADSDLPDKDKLVGGILDGFKKIDDSKIQN